MYSISKLDIHTSAAGHDHITLGALGEEQAALLAEARVGARKQRAGLLKPPPPDPQPQAPDQAQRGVPTFIDQVPFGPLAEPGPPQTPNPIQNQTSPHQQTTQTTETQKTNPHTLVGLYWINKGSKSA